jgi:hypothetical protein
MRSLSVLSINIIKFGRPPTEEDVEETSAEN